MRQVRANTFNLEVAEHCTDLHHPQVHHLPTAQTGAVEGKKKKKSKIACLAPLHTGPGVGWGDWSHSGLP